MAATRRLLFAQALSHLDSDLRGPFAQLVASPAYQEFLERRGRHQGPGHHERPARRRGHLARRRQQPVDGRRAQPAPTPYQAIAERVTPAAAGILVKIGVAGGAGLLAVIASILLSLRFRKRLVRELAGLRDAATELAEVRLVRTGRRLRTTASAQHAERGAAAGGQDAIPSEVRDIVQAFNNVQSTAVEAAVSQARLRHGVNQVFVNLARRNQSLLHRQLLQLDGMERRTEEPEALEDLFRLDHLTTRMRRHAESLIILSGPAPGRGWRNPVPIIDVLRAAVAEVEDYAAGRGAAAAARGR